MIKKGILYLFILCAFSATASDPVKEALAKAGDAAKYPGENQLVVFDSMLVDVQESGLGLFLSALPFQFDYIALEAFFGDFAFKESSDVLGRVHQCQL